MRITKPQQTLATIIDDKIEAHQATILFLSMEIQALKNRRDKVAKINTVPFLELSQKMSVRLTNCLQNAELDNTERLLDFIYTRPQPRSLMSIKNLGRKYRHELRDILLEVLGIDIEEIYRP